MLAGLLLSAYYTGRATVAYTGCSPPSFQTPVRRLGYRLALDYKVKKRGLQGSWHQAPLVDDSLFCHATSGATDDGVRLRGDVLREMIEAREPYHLKLKQGPDSRGAIRLQCPAAGPSPAVTVPADSDADWRPGSPNATVPANSPTPTLKPPVPCPRTPLRPSRRRQPSVDGIRRRVKNDDSLDRYQRCAYDTDGSTQCGLGHSIDRDR